MVNFGKSTIFSLFFFLSMFLVKTLSSSPSPSNLQILNAERRIDLTSHIVRVYLTLKVENAGEAPAAEVLLAFPPTQFDHLALVKAAGTVGKKKKKSYLPLEAHPSALPDAPNGNQILLHIFAQTIRQG
ncbi:Dolichyl-diphosphooligosaccharide--protein glycosyltransferase subunit 1B [Abeliophyllum distichum]|uniref:Dolichyl-diphosphooligosaccharide--protein glycosyltransferase subunit 1 n=1 Tax=Abeliophyllum distichum TaxID=126358 RepID=A0ABD1VQX4_9LAMI